MWPFKHRNPWKSRTWKGHRRKRHRHQKRATPKRTRTRRPPPSGYRSARNERQRSVKDVANVRYRGLRGLGLCVVFTFLNFPLLQLAIRAWRRASNAPRCLTRCVGWASATAGKGTTTRRAAAWPSWASMCTTASTASRARSSATDGVPAATISSTITTCARA